MRILKTLAALLGVGVVLVLVLELAFRVAGLWVAGDPLPTADGSIVVLCVGDSHTRGRPGSENYPAQLERILGERAAGRYRVINVGVPGQNTAQVGARFARYLDYYRPAVVLHWAGINNYWNRAEREGMARGVTSRIAEGSRVWRFLRVARFYRRLRTGDEPVPEERGVPGPHKDFRVTFGGKEELIRAEPGADLPIEQVRTLTRDDLTAMMHATRQRGIPMYAVTYSWWGGYFDAVNQAIKEVSAAFGVPYLDAAAAVQVVSRESPGAQLHDAWVHPMPIVYRQVAEQAYRMLVEQGMVRPRR